MCSIGDVNGDGNPDVVVIPYGRDLRDPKQLGVRVLLGDGRGGLRSMLGSPFSLAGCRGPSRVAIGDIKGNGLHDMAVSCAQNDKLFFFMGTKKGTFDIFSHKMPTGWGGIGLADLTGNGRDDVIVSNVAAGTITILLSK